MQKQTIRISFNPSDMKDYVYAVAGELNKIIDGTAQPVYDHGGIWYIKIEFNKINLKFSYDLCAHFYYKFNPELSANTIYETIAKDIVRYTTKPEVK